MSVLREKIVRRSGECIEKLNCKMQSEKFSLAWINVFILHFSVVNFQFSILPLLSGRHVVSKHFHRFSEGLDVAGLCGFVRTGRQATYRNRICYNLR